MSLPTSKCLTVHNLSPFQDSQFLYSPSLSKNNEPISKYSSVNNSLKGPNSKFSFPKSLWNVYDCLYAAVGDNPNAIVLDYHAGSGTTGHAVFEMNKTDNGNRRFILCEQMDYIETETNIRLKNAIGNEKLNESFTYFELKKFNEYFIDMIEEAKDSKALLETWEHMKAKSFLNYNVDIKRHEYLFDRSIIFKKPRPFL